MNQDGGDLFRPRNYEMLGAPVLLYRNEDAYTDLDLPQPRRVSFKEMKALHRKRRVQARWYYPMDFHRINNVAEDESRNFTDQQSRRNTPVNNGSSDDKDDSGHESDSDHTKDGIRRKRLRKEVKENYTDRETNFSSDESHRKERLPSIQQRARYHMLCDQGQEQDSEVIRRYEQFDVDQFPSKLPNLEKGDGGKARKAACNLKQNQEDQLFFYRKQRIDYSDPSYLAPFHQSSWMGKRDLRRGLDVSDLDKEMTVAREYGNCLICFPCSCEICSRSETPTWWVLHPMGPLMERIRLSHFATASGRKVWREIKFQAMPGLKLSKKMGSFSRPATLDTGDSVREIIQCGTDLFIARGTSHFTIFRIIQADVKNSPPDDEMCMGGTRVLKIVQRVDRRSFLRGSLSYYPRNLAAHPRFGKSLSDARFAVVNELESRDVCNSIHHYVIGDEIRSTEHNVRGLQLISDLQYSSSHPMVLWVSARSYARPLPTRDHLRGIPRVGFGNALFTIDLRCDKATFQFSPSSEEYSTEGTHSVSGLLTDWDQDNTLIVSSITAKKTWEVDMRMPCRPINCWSLPHYSEGPGAGSSNLGIFGAGMILGVPMNASDQHSRKPILAVNRSRGSYGFHLYQRPCRRPAFQCPPTESTFIPALRSASMSVASSMVFSLPDVLGPVFTCGLASFYLPTRDVFHCMQEEEEEIIEHAPSSLCVLSSTNKGDVYLHSLLASDSDKVLSKGTGSMPLGSTSVPVPHDHPVLDRGAPFNWLPVNITNEYPLPSRAIVNPLKISDVMAEENGNKWVPGFEVETNSVHVKPDSTQPFRLNAGTDDGVDLNISFLESHEEAFAATLECFDKDLPRVQRREMILGRDMERTDLTGDTIENAELDWTRYGYESDQSENRDDW